MVAEVGTGGWPAEVNGEWTVEMLDELPEDNLRYELLDGTLLVSPSSVPLHQAVIGELIQETPTLVVEVSSPSSARIDRMLKFSRYAQGGIEQYWIVDPRVPSIAVFHLIDGEYSLLASAEGAETISLALPFTVSLTPAQLITI